MSLYFFLDTKKNIQIPIYFVHIPKCAGTTVEALFEELNFKTFLSPKDYRWVRPYLKVPPTHFDIAMIEKIFVLEKFYSFAIVRNPYQRMLSDYKWAKTIRKRSNKTEWDKIKSNREEFFNKLSFEEFCTFCIKQYHADNNFMANHIMPQHRFISSNINKIFKLEDGLEKAIEEVFADLGLHLSKKLVLPKINASKNEEIEISTKAKQIIYDFYKEDFIKFKYEK